MHHKSKIPAPTLFSVIFHCNPLRTFGLPLLQYHITSKHVTFTLKYCLKNVQIMQQYVETI
jgi:hypothetical protein